MFTYEMPALEMTSLLSECGWLDVTTSVVSPDDYTRDDSNNDFFNGI